MWKKFKNIIIAFTIGLIIGLLLCTTYIYNNSRTVQQVITTANELRRDNQELRELTSKLREELKKQGQYYSTIENTSIGQLENVTTLEGLSGESWQLLEGNGTEVQRLGEQNQQFNRLLEEIGKTKQDIKN